MRPLSLNTLWSNQTYHASMFARKKGVISEHGRLNILLGFYIPCCELQRFDGVCTWNRLLVSLCTRQGYYHINMGGEERQRETWVELGRNVWGTKMFLAARKSIILLTFFLCTNRYIIFLCLESGVTCREITYPIELLLDEKESWSNKNVVWKL